MVININQTIYLKEFAKNFLRQTRMVNKNLENALADNSSEHCSEEGVQYIDDYRALIVDDSGKR